MMIIMANCISSFGNTVWGGILHHPGVVLDVFLPVRRDVSVLRKLKSDWNKSSMRFSKEVNHFHVKFYTTRCCKYYNHRKNKIKIPSYLSKTPKILTSHYVRQKGSRNTRIFLLYFSDERVTHSCRFKRANHLLPLRNALTNWMSLE